MPRRIRSAGGKPWGRTPESVTDGARGRRRLPEERAAGHDGAALIVLLHPPGLSWRDAVRRAAGALGTATDGEVSPRPFAPGEREEAIRGGGAAEAWALLSGSDLSAAAAPPASRLVALPRADPRWSLEDLLSRTLDRLPPGARVVVPTGLGEALLRRARPDLEPVRAGTFPVPEETPVLAEGPFRGGAGIPLDAARFLPPPGAGIDVLLPPLGETMPEAVRAAADAEAATALIVERALAEGVGPLPAGAALGALARRKISILFELRAVLFLPGAAARDVRAEIPVADARAFARGFGRHLREGTNETRNSP